MWVHPCKVYNACKVTKHCEFLTMVARTPGLAVVINLDYMNISCELCRMLWLMVERSMLQAGFSVDSRVFVSSDPDAATKARLVMKGLEPAFESFGVSQFDAVKEFYCYDLASRIDLNMADANDVVEVVELPN